MRAEKTPVLDPNANLLEQERLIEWLSGSAGRRSADLFDNARRLRELRLALFAWLDSGGPEPDWSRAPRARQIYGR